MDNSFLKATIQVLMTNYGLERVIEAMKEQTEENRKVCLDFMKSEKNWAVEICDIDIKALEAALVEMNRCHDCDNCWEVEGKR